MVNRRQLVGDLEAFIQECFDAIENLNSYQKISQNDARITFFKHLANVVDSTILFLVVAHKYLGDENWWKDTQKEYVLAARPIPFDKEFDYYDLVVTISYFQLIFSVFESSVRLIVKTYDPPLYQSQRDFNPLCKRLLSDLGLSGKEDFIDLISTIRNSIHNNGRFVPRGSTKTKRIKWNNILFSFDEDKPIIISQLWSTFIPFSKEIFNIFSCVISSPEIMKRRYYPDPSE